MLYPFVPYMVRDFGVARGDVGFYAGVLASAYNVAQLPAGVFWGRISDVYGRIPVLFVGLVGQAISLLLLGVSTSVPFALVARFVGGLLNGNAGVSRAVMKEITTSENRAHGFSLFGMAWGIGFFIGPILGGVLSRPADAFPELLRGSVLEAHPYLLPCMCAALNSLVWIATLPKLRPPKKSVRSSTSAADAPSDAKPGAAHGSLEDGAAAPAAAMHEGVELPAAPPSVAPAAEESDDRKLLGGGSTSACDCFSCCRRGRVMRASSLCSPLMMTIWAQTFLHLTVIGMAELYPLFAADSVQGLRLSPADVGESLIPLGAALLAAPFVWPRLNRRFGAACLFRVGVFNFLVINACFPFLRAARDSSEASLWAGVVCINAFRGFSGPLAFGSISLIMNNLMHKDLGLMNGLAQSFSAAARAIAPAVCGSLWTAATTGEAAHAFPFDYHMPFYFLSVVAMLALATTARFG